MKVNTDKRIRAGYIAAFLLLFISYLITFYTAEKLRDQSQLVNYTNSVISNFENLLSGVKDAQRGSRGYFIVGDSAFLIPHINSSKVLDSAYHNLQVLLDDEKYDSLNNQQKQRLRRLQDSIGLEYTVIENALAAFKQNNFQVSDSIKKLEYRNKILMDHIDDEINNVQDSENNEMQKRIKQIEQYITTLQIINITSLIIAILLSVYSITIFNKESRGQAKSRPADCRLPQSAGRAHKRAARQK